VKSVTHLFSDLEPTNYPEFEGDAIGLFTKLIPSREDKRVISEMTMALQLMKTQFQFTHSEMSAIVNMCRMTHNATELRHHLPSTSLGISSKWSDLQDYYCGDNDPVLTNIVCPRVDCKRLQSNSSARTCDSCGDILRKTSDIPLETIARVPLIFLLKLQLEDPYFLSRVINPPPPSNNGVIDGLLEIDNILKLVSGSNAFKLYIVR